MIMVTVWWAQRHGKSTVLEAPHSYLRDPMLAECARVALIADCSMNCSWAPISDCHRPRPPHFFFADVDHVPCPDVDVFVFWGFAVLVPRQSLRTANPTGEETIRNFRPLTCVCTTPGPSDTGWRFTSFTSV